METYKLGNKANCIIRSFSGSNIGEVQMTYGNQPYTVLKDIEATVNFKQIEKKAKTDLQQLGYYADSVSEVRIPNVILTNKILNLIFLKSEVKLCNVSKNFITDANKKIFLDSSLTKIYQVFIYNDEGNLERAEGEIDLTQSHELTLQKANSSYLIFYSYEGTLAYSLNKNNNKYLTLDLEILGNKEDETNTSWIHIEKCVITIDKTISLYRSSNTVDLIFKVLDTGEDYITLE